jgi:glycosyltransferase involved in cell wall biosynthesis
VKTVTPLVSVVIPMLNEIGFIEACLDSFARQTYGSSGLDVIVVDGGSTDGSRELVEKMRRDHHWIRVIENPNRKASAAFNRGVEAARGDVVCLFSAHGEAAPDYIERSVAVLYETDAVGVGGRYLHEGLDPASSAVGLAMVSPFGMASSHRFTSQRREVDTISHPAYDTAFLRATGSFDETLERNSDYEMNFRLRQAGGRLLFDPTVSSVYRPRPSLRALARQFWWYGRWKARVAQRHPASVKPRHLVAPAAVAFAAATPALILSSAGRRAVVLAVAAYASLLAGAVVTSRPADHDADVVTLVQAFPVMHGAWGAGFIASLLEDLVGRR